MDSGGLSFITITGAVKKYFSLSVGYPIFPSTAGEFRNDRDRWHAVETPFAYYVAECTGEGNGHYQLHLKPILQRLHSFDLRYWPDITGIIRSLRMEEVEVTFRDEATEAIINARRPSLTDFFRELFDNISMQKTGDYYALPRSFKLSDAALATICNITRDLPPDELVDAVYVKRTRHRLKEQGFSAVW